MKRLTLARTPAEHSVPEERSELTESPTWLQSGVAQPGRVRDREAAGSKVERSIPITGRKAPGVNE
jgi:hypothetical protein